MTLTKKLAISVLAMLFLVFIGTYLITLNNARNFFIQQIESNAQDTATSLGLSLSQSVASHDLATMNSMVQAVFDRGYFSLIEIRGIKGNILVSKKQIPQQSDIPGWFLNLIQWPQTGKSSLVMDGWIQAGKVLVSSNPGYAYSSLWSNAIEMIKAYLIFALIALILIYSFIQFLLRPLKRVTEQALAISAHEFPIETHIPKTPELKQVTLAMNHMVHKIKSLFNEQLKQTEILRKEVYQDALTGMSNRRFFLQQLASILDNEDEYIPGHIVMIVIDGLDELNQRKGYQQGDNLVLTVANWCKKFWNQSSVSIMARISGSTFALINHERDQDIFNQECKEFEEILRSNINDIGICKAYIGATDYFTHQSISNLLTMVDLAVKKAHEKGVFYCQKELDTFKYPRLLTGEDLNRAVDQKTLRLYAQAIKNDKTCLHKEIFVRLSEHEGEELGAGYFMPLAENLGLAHRIDLFVLHELLSNKSVLKEHFALNVSNDTLLNQEYSKDFLNQIRNSPSVILKNISLEINESVVLSHFSEAKLFVAQAKKIGVTIGVDRAGIHFSPLYYLRDLQIDYLKLHGSLVQDIDENESKQFFIHYFNEMAKTLDIQVIATQIEHQAQWRAIQEANIPWGQGRFIAGVELLKH